MVRKGGRANEHDPGRSVPRGKPIRRAIRCSSARPPASALPAVRPLVMRHAAIECGHRAAPRTEAPPRRSGWSRVPSESLRPSVVLQSPAAERIARRSRFRWPTTARGAARSRSCRRPVPYSPPRPTARPTARGPRSRPAGAVELQRVAAPKVMPVKRAIAWLTDTEGGSNQCASTTFPCSTRTAKRLRPEGSRIGSSERSPHAGAPALGRVLRA